LWITVTKALTRMCAGWKSVYLFLFVFFIYYKIVHNSTVWGYTGMVEGGIPTYIPAPSDRLILLQYSYADRNFHTNKLRILGFSHAQKPT